MKRFIGFVGEDRSFISNVAMQMSLAKAVSGVFSVNEPLYTVLLEIFRGFKREDFEEDGEFKKPIEIDEDHIRLFFAKMFRGGVFSVQDFAGYKFNTTFTFLDFFKNKVGVRAYGNDWLLLILEEEIKKLADGVYAISGLSLDEAKILKQKFHKDFALVKVVANSENEKDDEKADAELIEKGEVDMIVRAKQGMDGIKRETNKMLNKLKNRWKEK